MKTKNIICFILATVIGIFSLAGCTESTQKYNIFSENSESNKTEKAAENRDDLNSIMKSWKIFNEAVSDSSGELDSDTITEVIKQAMESEADNNRINIKLICSKARAEEYKSIAGEFVWLYADDRRFNLNIEIFTTEKTSEKNINNPKSAPDIFFYNDSELETAVSSGAVARINDNLKKFDADTDIPESIKAFTMNDKLYGMPTASAEGTYLIYDKRIFGENDMSPASETNMHIFRKRILTIGAGIIALVLALLVLSRIFLPRNTVRPTGKELHPAMPGNTDPNLLRHKTTGARSHVPESVPDHLP